MEKEFDRRRQEIVDLHRVEGTAFAAAECRSHGRSFPVNVASECDEAPHRTVAADESPDSFRCFGDAFAAEAESRSLRTKPPLRGEWGIAPGAWVASQCAPESRSFCSVVLHKSLFPVTGVISSTIHFDSFASFWQSRRMLETNSDSRASVCLRLPDNGRN